ncbi:MAG: hypothetical protein O3B68_17765 [Planctomycetota bacterium]|nr:hypothetical protein [Planctomycetota bacterium]
MVEPFDKSIYAAAQRLRQLGGVVTLWSFVEQPLTVNLSGVKSVKDVIDSLGLLPNVENLDLTGTDVGDDDLAIVAQQPTLMRLYLASTRITDAAIAHIADLPKLFVLDIRDTLVSGVGLRRLAEGSCPIGWLGIQGARASGAHIMQFEKNTGAWITNFDD